MTKNLQLKHIVLAILGAEIWYMPEDKPWFRLIVADLGYDNLINYALQEWKKN